jgi:hypothetical protein
VRREVKKKESVKQKCDGELELLAEARLLRCTLLSLGKRHKTPPYIPLPPSHRTQEHLESPHYFSFETDRLFFFTHLHAHTNQQKHDGRAFTSFIVVIARSLFDLHFFLFFAAA